jgi:hypothetical protein
MVGIFYNDVWAYKLCESRDDNGIANETSCFEEGWTLWHPGARQGGCVIGLSGLVILFFECFFSLMKIIFKC